MIIAVNNQNPREDLILSEYEGFGFVLLSVGELEVVFLGFSLVCFIDSFNDVNARIKVKRRLIFFFKTFEQQVEVSMMQLLLEDQLKLLNV